MREALQHKAETSEVNFHCGLQTALGHWELVAPSSGCYTLSTELGGFLQAYLVGFPLEIIGDSHGLAPWEASPRTMTGKRARCSSQHGNYQANEPQKAREYLSNLVHSHRCNKMPETR